MARATLRDRFLGDGRGQSVPQAVPVGAIGLVMCVRVTIRILFVRYVVVRVGIGFLRARRSDRKHVGIRQHGIHDECGGDETMDAHRRSILLLQRKRRMPYAKSIASAMAAMPKSSMMVTFVSGTLIIVPRHAHWNFPPFARLIATPRPLKSMRASAATFTISNS